MTQLAPLSVAELKCKLDADEAVLLDVRESDEHAREHILGARLAPLSTSDAHYFDSDHDKIAVFHCRAGMPTPPSSWRAASAKAIACKAASRLGRPPSSRCTPTARRRWK